MALWAEPLSRGDDTQGLFQNTSEVAQHALRLGCARPSPHIGLCVNCPLQAACKVPRVSIMLWAARITQDIGSADTTFYLNELTTAAIGKKHRLKGSGRRTFREKAVEARCGDLFVDPNSFTDEKADGATVNLPTYIHDQHGIEYEACRKRVAVEARQLRHLQVSNYGRKAIVGVQCCSKECAERLAGLVNRNWQMTTSLLRDIRPLR